jgi:hypothetical protein
MARKPGSSLEDLQRAMEIADIHYKAGEVHLLVPDFVLETFKGLPKQAAMTEPGRPCDVPVDPGSGSVGQHLYHGLHLSPERGQRKDALRAQSECMCFVQ